MKLSEIQPGVRYRVQIPDEVDSVVHDQSYRGEVEATVKEVGVYREVTTYGGSRIHGDRGTRRVHRSEHADGVVVEWEEQEVIWRYGRRGQEHTHVHGGRGVIPARNVRHCVESPAMTS